MKYKVYFIIILFLLSIVSLRSYSNCNNSDNGISEDDLYAIGLTFEDGESVEKLVFTGKDIKSFNLTTREIVFFDSVADILLTKLEINFYRKISIIYQRRVDF